MKKTIYLGGRLGVSENQLESFSEELEARGHVVLEKWFLSGPLPRPYLDNVSTSAPAAETMLEAAYEADVAILFPADDILGAAVEFGAALASQKHNPKKFIIVVNPFKFRQSIFYAHKGVRAVKGIADIRQLEWY